MLAQQLYMCVCKLHHPNAGTKQCTSASDAPEQGGYKCDATSWEEVASRQLIHSIVSQTHEEPPYYESLHADGSLQMDLCSCTTKAISCPK